MTEPGEAWELAGDESALLSGVDERRSSLRPDDLLGAAGGGRRAASELLPRARGDSFVVKRAVRVIGVLFRIPSVSLRTSTEIPRMSTTLPGAGAR